MVRVGFKNTKKVLGDLSRFGDFIKRDQVVHFNRVIPKDFYRINKEVFKSEGAKGDHGKWARLSPKYKDWKDKHYPSKTIMRRTDKLFKSLTSHTSDSIKFIGKVGQQLHIRLGTSLDYGEYHQVGIQTSKGKKTRRTIDLDEYQMIGWLKMIHHAYVMAARGAFDKTNIKIPRWDKKERRFIR